MDLGRGRRSTNIEDRRGMRIGRTGAGLSLGGVAVLVVLSLLGINPLPFLGLATQEGRVVEQPSDQPYQESSSEARYRQIAEVVLGETETTWTRLLGGQYRPTTAVLYTEQTESACGTGQAAMGPFYCPDDQKIYLDLSFFDDLQSRFGAGGDFADSYVVAHEVGHHVQRLLGIADQVHAQQQSLGRGADANALSVQMELQADCYAGVWGHDAAPRLNVTEQDVDDALRAANAIGDDRLQRQAQGFVVPDSFTHGSSAQRKHWFTVGFQTGDPRACDTFNAREL